VVTICKAAPGKSWTVDLDEFDLIIAMDTVIVELAI